ncbi:MAG: MarR family transcriptional regulator [Methanocalculaceae archaeon]|jgi:hypothetical protein|nr:MarR family transcriptional regulator [Methanocalculaceae archaeon]
MRDEEIDWALYHLLPDGQPVMIAELAENSWFSQDAVDASLARLENNCLIVVRDGAVSRLSLLDMLMMNKMMHAPDMPIYMENGVIKAKK